MTQVIYKYSFPVDEDTIIAMPKDSEILMLGSQAPGLISIWAQHDYPTQENDLRKFIVRGTGHPTPSKEEATYLDSVFDGPFVWHVFDAGAP